MRERPEHLLTRGRGENQTFAPDEKLFRRLMPLHFVDRQIDVDAVPLPDISVNRGAYSSAADVLFDEEGAFDSWGVLSIQVMHVPTELTHAGVFVYTIQVVHAPLRNNYAHSEIRAFENGQHVNKPMMAKVDRGFHLRFREHLLRKARVEIAPGEYKWDDS